ncbi:hypothetical protein BsWGS_17733 [Bradybaena similaris]
MADSDVSKGRDSRLACSQKSSKRKRRQLKVDKKASANTNHDPKLRDMRKKDRCVNESLPCTESSPPEDLTKTQLENTVSTFCLCPLF